MSILPKQAKLKMIPHNNQANFLYEIQRNITTLLMRTINDHETITNNNFLIADSSSKRINHLNLNLDI